MELKAAIRSRRMVRNYDPDRPVSREQVDELLTLAVRAPSAGFSQGWHFLVLDSASAIARFWRTTSDGGPPDRWLVGLRRAPVLVVALSDKAAYLTRYAEPDKGWSDRDEDRWPIPYWYVDTGMAAELILLGAVDAGLGSCLFGVPADKWDALRSEFAIPIGLDPVAVVSIGHPPIETAGSTSRPPRPDSPGRAGRPRRRPLDELASYNDF